MADFILRQGDVTATLSEVFYQPVEGIQEGNNWYVDDESISADSDTKLTDGPATIRHGGIQYPVLVTVLGNDDEESEEGDPACTIEIGYAEG